MSAAPRAPERGRPVRAFLALAAVAAAVAAFFHLRPPTLVLENRLVEAVRVAVNGDPERTLGPGERAEIRLRRGAALAAQWYLVRPISPAGTPMGEEMQGTIVEERPSGRVLRAIDRRGTDRPYFAPLITNDTPEPLTITVNAGLRGALDCDCAVRPGVTRARIGYYRLYRNSTVRATGRDGRSATFTDLGPRAERAGGAVGLRFKAGDLRPHMR